MAEVLEPPGAAPVKTWKVCMPACFRTLFLKIIWQKMDAD
jgi:hypothetical protein